jgi:16S rRNA processing protein RimM
MVGTITGPHGVRGELRLRLTTDDPNHLQHVKRFFIGDEPSPRRLLSIRFHDGDALMRLGGIDSPEQVIAMRGMPVRIAGTDARPLGPGELYLYQLIGLEVVTEAGETLGRVIDLLETGANDVVVIRPPESGPEMLLPLHPDVILDVRPAEGKLIARPLRYYGEP